MTARTTFLAFAVFVLGSAQADAQVRSRPPSTGVGVYMGAWNLNGGGSVAGVVVTRPRHEWLTTEVSVDGGRPDAYHPRYGLLIGNLRLTGPASAARDGARPFVSAGLAAATGMSYRVSPMAGFGVVRGNPRMALRVELQLFSRGSGIRDAGRLLMGLAITR